MTDSMMDQLKPIVDNPSSFIDDEFLADIYLSEFQKTYDVELARKQVERYLVLKKDLEKLKTN